MNNRSQAIVAIPILLILITLLGISFVHATTQIHKAGLIYDKQQTPFATPFLLPTPTSTSIPANINITYPVLDPPPLIKITGNQIVNTITNKPIQLIGVSMSSLEYSCHGSGYYSLTDFMAIRSWGINTVRVPLSSQLFLNTQGTCPSYRQTVAQLVKTATQAGLYVILALQWNAPFDDPTSIGGSQYPMPDATNDVAFWIQISSLFRTSGNVIFDIFSEPHDINFHQWYYGGNITINDTNDYKNLNIPQLVHGTYQAIGVGKLAVIIRGLSPNIIIISGIDWGFDLSQLDNPQYIFPKTNIIFATHLWDHPNEQPNTWSSMFLNEHSHFPIIVSEMGEYDCQSNYISQVIPLLNKYNISWIGWTWSVGNCLNNSALLKSWDGTPNSPYSEFLRMQILNTVDQQPS